MRKGRRKGRGIARRQGIQYFTPNAIVFPLSNALSPHPPSFPCLLSFSSHQEKRQGGGHKGHWAATDDGTLMVTKGSLDKDDPNYDSAVRVGYREGRRVRGRVGGRV